MITMWKPQAEKPASRKTKVRLRKAIEAALANDGGSAAVASSRAVDGAGGGRAQQRGAQTGISFLNVVGTGFLQGFQDPENEKSSHWLPIKIWCALMDSNHRPLPCEGNALTN